MITVEDWHTRAAALRDELITAGKLTSPEWEEALLAIPRHKLVPKFFQQGPQGWEMLSASSPNTRERWWRGVWANTSPVTRLGSVGRLGAQAAIGPESSSSAPSLMTRMLEALQIRDGQRVLEIGTGTGYNAALLCHRLGDRKVFSVDIDAELVEHARGRLAALGYHPTLAAVDGVAGLPEHAPYDRIIATCAVSRVPWAWAVQAAKDGLILVDLKVYASVGNLVLLRREGDHLVGRFDAGYATFMHMRTAEFHVGARTVGTRDREDSEQRTTTLTHERLWDITPLWFLVHLTEGGRVSFGYAMDPATGGPGPVYFATEDGSWCELSPAGDGDVRQVWEGGPRRLWSRIESTLELWRQLGEPGWDRFGLTVTPDRQVVWLDEPTGQHRWHVHVNS
ncbi:MAG TPA: methyltransferase domain-containing protein [Pseudonocardiaceae bacterium]